MGTRDTNIREPCESCGRITIAPNYANRPFSFHCGERRILRIDIVQYRYPASRCSSTFVDRSKYYDKSRTSSKSADRLCNLIRGQRNIFFGDRVDEFARLFGNSERAATLDEIRLCGFSIRTDNPDDNNKAVGDLNEISLNPMNR